MMCTFVSLLQGARRHAHTAGLFMALALVVSLFAAGCGNMSQMEKEEDGPKPREQTPPKAINANVVITDATGIGAQITAAITAAGGGEKGALGTATNPIGIHVTEECLSLAGSNGQGVDPLHAIFSEIPDGVFIELDLTDYTGELGDVDDYALAARQNKESLVHVKLPESLELLGENSFRDCVNLTEVNVPENVTAIGASAFQNCTSLDTLHIHRVELPLTTLGEDALYGVPKEQIVPGIFFASGRAAEYKEEASWKLYLSSVSNEDDISNEGIEAIYEIRNNLDWNAAVAAIKAGGGYKTYVLDIKAVMWNIPPTMGSTFGDVEATKVILKGTNPGESMLIIDYNTDGYMLNVAEGQTVTLDKVGLTGKRSYGENTTALVRVSGGTLELKGTSYVADNLNISSISLQNFGGGVYVSSGKFIMSDESQVRDNAWKHGGHVEGAGVYVSGGTFTMKDKAKVRKNMLVPGTSFYCDYYIDNAIGKGAGVYVLDATFNMSGESEVSENTSRGKMAYGGGIYLGNKGVFNTYGTPKISGNIADGNGKDIGGKGGGVFIDIGAQMNMLGGTILKNAAKGSVNDGGAHGGGVYVSASGENTYGELRLASGTICGDGRDYLHDFNDASNSAEKQGSSTFHHGDALFMGKNGGNDTSSYGKAGYYKIVNDQWILESTITARRIDNTVMH